DLAHSHEFTMAFYGAWAARRARVPHVITMHGSRYYAGRLRRKLALRAAAGLSGGIVAVSQALAGQLSRDLWIRSTRITTIPNGFPLRPSRRVDDTFRARAVARGSPRRDRRQPLPSQGASCPAGRSRAAVVTASEPACRHRRPRRARRRVGGAGARARFRRPTPPAGTTQPP